MRINTFVTPDRSRISINTVQFVLGYRVMLQESMTRYRFVMQVWLSHQ
jgi:hypothetical protein